MKHQLYEQGLRCYKSKPEVHAKICQAYAESLSKAGRHEQSAAMYRAAGKFEDALECYKKTENWALARTMGLLLKWPPERMKQLAEDFLGVSRSADDYKNMAIVMEDLYRVRQLEGGVDEFVGVLVRARDYFRAIEVSAEQGRQDLIEGEIAKGVRLAYDILANDILRSVNTYNEKAQRLTVVQEQKRAMPVLSTDTLIAGLDFEQQSESGKSSSSKSSSRKGSGRSDPHKHVKKTKATIKEGSRFEEEQIIELLESLAPSPEVVKDVEYIKRCLDFYGQKGEGERLAQLLKDLQRLCERPVLSYEQLRLIEGHANFFEVFPKLKPKSN